jgi:hypothetical protein
MTNPDHIFESLETNQFFGTEYLNYLMGIRDPGWKNFEFGVREGNIRIRDKHPGSATLVFALLINYSVCAKAWECWPTAR